MATYTIDKIGYNGNTYLLQDAGALQLTGGNVTGPVNFGSSVSMDEATIGDLVVNGAASFTNNLQANTINGVTVGSSPKFTDTVYSHPGHTAYSSGLYKITVNNLGHVTAATAVAKADITGLGIPGSDTNTWRAIQVNGTDILGTGTNTNKLNLKAGSNVTITNSNGTVTIASSYTDTNTHYTANLITGASATATSNAANTTTNSIYLNLIENSTVRNSHNIVGSGATTVSCDANGKITISSTDTNTHNTYTVSTTGSGNAVTAVSLSGTTFTVTKGTTFLTSLPSHNHSQIVTVGDQRSTATTPNSYANALIFQGLKNKATIGNPSTDTYSYLVGLRGWSDSSGGKSHELAFNDTGINWRTGSTTTWDAWYKLLTTKDLNSTTSVGTIGSGKVYAIGLDANGKLAVSVPWTDTTYTLSGLGGVGTVSASGTAPLTLSASKSGTTVTITGSVAAVSSSSAGVAPKGATVSSQTQSTKFLREDGTWAVPSYTVNTNTDTLVTQAYSTTSNSYPLLMTATAGVSSTSSRGATTAILNNAIYANPSTGIVTTSGLTTKRVNELLTGSGTAASDKGSGVSPRYFPAKWTFNAGITPTNGDIITIKIPVAGHSYGVFVSTNNGTNYYPVVVAGTSRLTTHYGVNMFITLLFDSSGSAADMFALNGADTRATVTGGVWRVINYYDSGNTIPQAYCSTGASTAAKAASMSGYVATANRYIMVNMTTANSSAGAITLNINSTGAKPIYINGNASSSSNYTLPAGSYLVFYNGTNYYFRTDNIITGNITGNAATASSVAWSGVSGKPNLVNTITTTAGTHTAISSQSGNVSFNVPTTAAHVGIKFGYTTSGNNRAVQQDSSGNLYVTQKDDNSGGTVTKVTAGTGLSIGSTAGGNFTTTGTINHTNSVTAQTTQAIYPIKIDAQGHISAYGSAVTPLTSHQTIKQDGVTGATGNHFGTCSVAAGTAAKTVSITAGTPALEAGLRVTVKFSNANTAGTPTLNVNSLGAKNIFHNGAQITTGANKALLAGTVEFVYDGTQWQLVGNYVDTDTKAWGSITGKPTATGSKTTGISIAAHTTTSITPVSGSVTASKASGGNGSASNWVFEDVACDDITAWSAGSFTRGTFSGGSGSFTQGAFSGGSGSFSATVSNHVLSFSHTHNAATHGADTHTHTAATHAADSFTAPSLSYSAKTASHVKSGGNGSAPTWSFTDVTVPKAASAVNVVTSTGHTITDNGHTHSIS